MPLEGLEQFLDFDGHLRQVPTETLQFADDERKESAASEDEDRKQGEIYGEDGQGPPHPAPFQPADRRIEQIGEKKGDDKRIQSAADQPEKADDERCGSEHDGDSYHRPG